MDKKRQLLMALLMAAGGMLGAAVFSKLHVVTPIQARQGEEKKSTGGQSWEYCALTKAAYVASSRGGLYWIVYFRDTGVQVVEVETPATEDGGPAKAIAKLGGDGWEMVGQGPLEVRRGAVSALYFKRPRP